MTSSLPVSLAIALCANPAAESASHPFTVHDMLAMQRISEPRVSPDGNDDHHQPNEVGLAGRDNHRRFLPRPLLHSAR